jgi:hypothetical protein
LLFSVGAREGWYHAGRFKGAPCTGEFLGWLDFDDFHLAIFFEFLKLRGQAWLTLIKLAFPTAS